MAGLRPPCAVWHNRHQRSPSGQRSNAPVGAHGQGERGEDCGTPGHRDDNSASRRSAQGEVPFRFDRRRAEHHPHARAPFPCVTRAVARCPSACTPTASPCDRVCSGAKHARASALDHRDAAPGSIFSGCVRHAPRAGPPVHSDPGDAEVGAFADGRLGCLRPGSDHHPVHPTWDGCQTGITGVAFDLAGLGLTAKTS